MEYGINALIFSLTTGITSRSMYPTAHPKVQEGTDSLVEVLRGTLNQRKIEEITFLLVGDDLVEGDRPIRHTTLYVESFQKLLKRCRVERVTLTLTTTKEEVGRFLDGMCGRGPLENTETIILGRVHLDFDGGEGEGDAGGEGGEGMGGHSGAGEVRGFSERDLDLAQGSYASFRSDRKGSVKALDSAMWHLMEGLGRSSRSLLLLAPFKGIDDGAFIHAINVSLLVLGQAKTLGIGGQPLHDLGMAALLHDIGKLSLPPELLGRSGRLNEQEQAVMRQHPELGALHLSGVAGSSTLSVLVAYEHHLRWDGRPSFPVLKTPRRPNLGSQLTAIADTYDMALSLEPVPKETAKERALDRVQARAGTFLNPDLVEGFSRMLKTPSA